MRVNKSKETAGVLMVFEPTPDPQSTDHESGALLNRSVVTFEAFGNYHAFVISAIFFLSAKIHVK